MKKSRFLVTLAVALAMATGLAGTARAAVEDAIPQDAFLVIKVNGLDGAYDRFMNGPIVTQLRNPAFAPEAAAGLQKLDEGLASLKQQTGVDLVPSVKTIFGKEFVLAAFGENDGVLIAESSDASALQQAIESIQKLDQNKQTPPTTNQYRGVTIYTRPKRPASQWVVRGPDGKPIPTQVKADIWAVTGRFFIMSGQSAAVEKAIDTIQGAAPNISRSEKYAEAMRKVEAGALVTAYLDMTPIQAKLREEQAKLDQLPPDPGRRPILNRMIAATDSTSYLVGTVREGNGLNTSITAVFKDGRIPAGLAAILPPRGSRLEILDGVPSNAVLVAARNVNVQGIWNTLVDFAREIRPDAAQKMQTGIVSVANALGGIPTAEQLFAELGTQAAVMVLPSAGADQPPSVAVNMRLNDTSHIPVALQTLLGAALVAPAIQANASLETSVYSGVTMKIVHILRPGPLGKLTPTLALIGKDLVAATSADAVRSLVDSAGRGRADVPSAQGTAFIAGWVNAREVSALLAQYREPLIRKAIQDGKPEQQSRTEIAGLEKVLSLLDRVEWTVSFGEDRLDVGASVRPTAR